jgi:hypothetical protein
MVKRRRRFKQAVPFKDRLILFAQELQEEALRLPPGQDRDDLFKRARRADTAADLDEWTRSPGIQPST